MNTKILEVEDDDSNFDIYNDWLVGDCAKKAIDGQYTHIKCGTSIIEIEIVTFQDGEKAVMLGEDIGY